MSDNLEKRIQGFWVEYDQLLKAQKHKDHGVIFFNLHKERFPECEVGSKEWKERSE